MQIPLHDAVPLPDPHLESAPHILLESEPYIYFLSPGVTTSEEGPIGHSKNILMSMRYRSFFYFRRGFPLSALIHYHCLGRYPDTSRYIFNNLLRFETSLSRCSLLIGVGISDPGSSRYLELETLPFGVGKINFLDEPFFSNDGTPLLSFFDLISLLLSALLGIGFFDIMNEIFHLPLLDHNLIFLK